MLRLVGARFVSGWFRAWGRHKLDLCETILDVSSCAVGEACLLAEFDLVDIEVLRYRVKLSF